MDFVLDELPDVMGEAGLPFLAVVPHSESETRERFPGVCRHQAGVK